MSRLHALIIVITLSIQPALAEAQELWRGASAGMSLDQVLQQFPDASEPKYPEKLVNGRELLRVSPIDYCGEKLHAMFIFQKKKLNGVKIKPIDELNGIASEQLFSCIKADLTVEFGAPDEDASRSYTGAKGKISNHLAIWKGKGVRVVAMLLVTDDKSTILYVARFPDA